MMTLTYQDLVQTQLPWQEKTVHNSFLSTGTLPCWDSQVLVLPHLPPVTKHRSPSTASSTYKCSIIITGCGRIQDENLQVIFWHQARNELAYQHAFLSFNFILHYLQGKSNITYFYFYYIYQRWYNDHHCYFIVVRLLRSAVEMGPNFSSNIKMDYTFVSKICYVDLLLVRVMHEYSSCREL